MAPCGRQATREGAVKPLTKMLSGLITKAEKEGLKLAPFIGIACPGVINADGSIEKGAQNRRATAKAISSIYRPVSLRLFRRLVTTTLQVIMHNDGVVQGLSEFPSCRT